MHTFLVVTLVTLIPPLVIGLFAVAVRPRQADDLLKRAVGDAPRLKRGGYAAMGEHPADHAARSKNAVGSA